MKVTLLQTDIQWHNVSANIRTAERLIDAAPASDLYLLPEMWATGFDTKPDYDLIATADEALKWMKRTACERHCAVGGSLAVREWPEGVVAGDASAASSASLWRNRFYFVTPDGRCAAYDKRNLFTYGGEQLTYTPGTEAVIAEWRGVRFMLQTCFDLRFPETGRNRLASSGNAHSAAPGRSQVSDPYGNGLAEADEKALTAPAAMPYDVLLYVANWPASRRRAWDALLPARAIENQAYCIGVNRTGTDPSCLYDGGSAAYDALGTPLVVMGPTEAAVTVPLDLDALHALRQRFRVLR